MIHRSYFRLTSSLRRALELYAFSCLLLLCSGLLVHSSASFLSLNYYLIIGIALGWYTTLLYIFTKKAYKEITGLLFEKTIFLVVITLYFISLLTSSNCAAFTSLLFKMMMISSALTFLNLLHMGCAALLKKQTSFSYATFIETYYGSAKRIAHVRTIRNLTFVQGIIGLFSLFFVPNSCTLESLGAFLLLTIPASYGIVFISGAMRVYSWMTKEVLYAQSPQSLEQLAQCNTLLVPLDDVLLEQQANVVEIHTLHDATQELVVSHAHLLAAHSSESLFQILKTVAVLENQETHAIENIREFHGKGIRATINSQEWFLGTTKFIEEIRFTTLEAKNDFKLLKKQTKKYAQEEIIPLFLATNDTLYGYFLVRDALKSHASSLFSSLKRFFVHQGIMTPFSKDVANSYAEKIGATIVLHDLLPKKEAAKIKQLHNEEYRMAILATTEHMKALHAAQSSILLSATPHANVDFCLEPTSYLHVFPTLCAAAKALRAYQQRCTFSLYGWITFLSMLLISSLIYPIFYVTIERALFLTLLFSLFLYGHSALFHKQLKQVRLKYKLHLPMPLE